MKIEIIYLIVNFPTPRQTRKQKGTTKGGTGRARGTSAQKRGGYGEAGG